MGKINVVRVLLGGLLAGLVLNILDYLRTVIMAEQWMAWFTIIFFILGIIICVVIILIPKLSLAIFIKGRAAADIGSYGTGITAGVVISTIWDRLKMVSVTATRQLASRTGSGVISGAQALTRSPTATSTETALRSFTNEREGSGYLTDIHAVFGHIEVDVSQRTGTLDHHVMLALHIPLRHLVVAQGQTLFDERSDSARDLGRGRWQVRLDRL